MTSEQSQMKLVYTVNEVAEVLRIGRNLAYEMVRTGDIPSIRMGKRILVPGDGLKEMLGGVPVQAH